MKTGGYSEWIAVTSGPRRFPFPLMALMHLFTPITSWISKLYTVALALYTAASARDTAPRGRLSEHSRARQSGYAFCFTWPHCLDLDNLSTRKPGSLDPTFESCDAVPDGLIVVETIKGHPVAPFCNTAAYHFSPLSESIRDRAGLAGWEGTVRLRASCTST